MSRRLNATLCSLKLKHSDFKQDSWSPRRVPWPFTLFPLEALSCTRLLSKCQDPNGQTGLLLPEKARDLSKVTQRARHRPEARTSGTCFLSCLSSQGLRLWPGTGREERARAAKTWGSCRPRPRRSRVVRDTTETRQRMLRLAEQRHRDNAGRPAGTPHPELTCGRSRERAAAANPGLSHSQLPRMGRDRGAHFLSNPARRPTSLATASISITLLGLQSEEPAEGRDPECRVVSQVPSARH